MTSTLSPNDAFIERLSNEHIRQPAPLEGNAVQPMHHHVSGARFRSARRLGYDGGGDLNTCAEEA